MSQTAVQEILQRIHHLSDIDREQLLRQLDESLAAEWRKEADRARNEAKVRGIDQAMIDSAIEARRYGR